MPQRRTWEHGTRWGYEGHGCRCEPCATARSAYFTGWRNNENRAGLLEREAARREGNREHIRAYTKGWNAAGRRRVLDHYGSRCACCGEREILFLSIDHIDGGGNAHRKVIHNLGRIHRWLEKNNYPEGFQVLCHNCNQGRHLNGGVCPHEGA